jgi:predicted nucleotidyltransferase
MFFSDNQLEILTIFFSRPDVELHMNELGRILGKKPGTFQKGLNKLEEGGVLKSTRRGNQRLFSLNDGCPILDEIRGIVQKTAGITASITSALNDIDEIKLAFLFGSFVHDRMRPDSDIDIVIVCPSEAQGRILKALDLVEKKVLREINPKFYTPTGFAQKRKDGDPFLTEILSDKTIILKGMKT